MVDSNEPSDDSRSSMLLLVSIYFLIRGVFWVKMSCNNGYLQAECGQTICKKMLS